MFFKIDVLKNLAIFAGRHLCWSLFDEDVGLKVCTFIKKRLQHRCFPLDIAKFLRTAFFIEHLRWLLHNELLQFIETGVLTAIMTQNNCYKIGIIFTYVSTNLGTYIPTVELLCCIAAEIAALCFLRYHLYNVNQLTLMSDLKNTKGSYPPNIYLFKLNNRNPRKRCEIYSKLTINTPERRQ